MAEKLCPKCPSSQTMKAMPTQAIIPAMRDENFVDVKPVSDRAGYPVSVYECPSCHFVELYHES